MLLCDCESVPGDIWASAGNEKRLSDRLRMVRLESNVLLLLPGAYAVCEDPILLAGAQLQDVDAAVP